MNHSLSNEAILSRPLLRQIEIGTWSLTGLGFLLGWLYPLTAAERNQVIMWVLASIVYGIIVYHWILPKFGPQTWVNLLSISWITVFVTNVDKLFRPYGADTGLVMFVLIVIIGILSGWRLGVLTAVMASLSHLAVTLTGSSVSELTLLHEAYELLIFLATGYMAGVLASVNQQQTKQIEKRNQDLSFLLDTSQTLSTLSDLKTTLVLLAEKIAKGTSVTCCRILLRENDSRRMVTYGAYPLRPLEGWDPKFDASIPLDELPKLRESIESGRTLIAQQDNGATALSETEKKSLFFATVKSACLVPLVTQGNPVGMIALGQARSWARDPFNQSKRGLLETIAAQVAIVVSNARLHESTKRNAERVALLNTIAGTIGSTIELDDLLETCLRQLLHVLAADSYYIGLYDPKEDSLQLRIDFDEGKRFAPSKFPIGKGLSSYVVRERKPLLIRHLSEEVTTLPVVPVITGTGRPSQSWLGVPMIVEIEVIGVLAFGSYSENAFDEDDLNLLTSVASQVAMAVDNAQHHAEVEEQARCDSLTQAFNHGYLLLRLHEEIEQARMNGTSVSLIMLDIDHFKKFNDTYGHVVGDQVLKLIVQVIKASLKKSDRVGRWGGEEFAIVLPDALITQAREVGERIRSKLTEMPLISSEGQSLPKPTVSQGIATFPQHATSAEKLLDIADRALYTAKARGRDQIQIAFSEHESN